MNQKGNTLSWFWRYRRLYLWLHFMFCLLWRGATFSRLTTNLFCIGNVPFATKIFEDTLVRWHICLKLLPTIVFRETSWFHKVRNFFSGSVYMIFYHQKWNFISVKMTKMNQQPQSCKQLQEIDQTSINIFHFARNEISCKHPLMLSIFNIAFTRRWK